jgi:hypothetical protein
MIAWMVVTGLDGRENSGIASHKRGWHSGRGKGSFVVVVVVVGVAFVARATLRFAVPFACRSGLRGASGKGASGAFGPGARDAFGPGARVPFRVVALCFILLTFALALLAREWVRVSFVAFRRVVLACRPLGSPAVAFEPPPGPLWLGASGPSEPGAVPVALVGRFTAAAIKVVVVVVVVRTGSGIPAARKTPYEHSHIVVPPGGAAYPGSQKTSRVLPLASGLNATGDAREFSTSGITVQGAGEQYGFGIRHATKKRAAAFAALRFGHAAKRAPANPGSQMTSNLSPMDPVTGTKPSIGKQRRQGQRRSEVRSTRATGPTEP